MFGVAARRRDLVYYCAVMVLFLVCWEWGGGGGQPPRGANQMKTVTKGVLVSINDVSRTLTLAWVQGWEREAWRVCLFCLCPSGHLSVYDATLDPTGTF